jgi:hypothetical protein
MILLMIFLTMGLIAALLANIDRNLSVFARAYVAVSKRDTDPMDSWKREHEGAE